ncbi:MAG: hypothetical protein IGR76_17140 [Synechococcales cyanobacterium T60_A2020_003]|nr:hypothetical protein [Synechococcales cyanobacterium T60_A2020_003]
MHSSVAIKESLAIFQGVDRSVFDATHFKSAPAPDADLVYPTGVWHFARGMALTAQGKLDEAAQELESLQAIANHH